MKRTRGGAQKRVGECVKERIQKKFIVWHIGDRVAGRVGGRVERRVWERVGWRVWERVWDLVQERETHHAHHRIERP